MKQHWRLVDNPTQLAAATVAIRCAEALAIDTEYDSYRYFRDLLCLIQVQTDETTWLIDPLAGLDLAFLGETFDSPSVLKVFHAGDNDIRLLKRDYGFMFRNLFDTHRAAALLGVRQLSLHHLVETNLGVTLEKKLQRSRWDLRPLAGEQLDYAALDTAHLFALHRRLADELRARGLEDAAERLFAETAAVVWQPRSLDSQAHRRLPGYATLNPAQKRRLRELFRWRFEKAREIDRAAFLVLPDHHLVGLARLENPSVESMADAGLLSPEKMHRFGEELLRTLRSA